MKFSNSLATRTGTETIIRYNCSDDETVKYITLIFLLTKT